MTDKPLWICPDCGRQFANRNQWHSCGQFTVEAHLEGKTPHAGAHYHRFVEVVEGCGPVTIAPTKTRIGFKVRMTFAAIRVRQRWLDGHLVLARRVEQPRFTFVESPSARNHVHGFRIESGEAFDKTFKELIKESYGVGEQRHLEPGYWPEGEAE